VKTSKIYMDVTGYYENSVPAPPSPRHGKLISRALQNTNCASQTNKEVIHS